MDGMERLIVVFQASRQFGNSAALVSGRRLQTTRPRAAPSIHCLYLIFDALDLPL